MEKKRVVLFGIILLIVLLFCIFVIEKVKISGFSLHEGDAVLSGNAGSVTDSAASSFVGGNNSGEGKIKECYESWQCTDWSACFGNFKTMNCYDANSCGTEAKKPLEKIQCTEEKADNIYKFEESKNLEKGIIEDKSCEIANAKWTDKDNKEIERVLSGEIVYLSFDASEGCADKKVKITVYENDLLLTNAVENFERIILGKSERIPYKPRKPTDFKIFGFFGEDELYFGVSADGKALTSLIQEGIYSSILIVEEGKEGGGVILAQCSNGICEEGETSYNCAVDCLDRDNDGLNDYLETNVYGTSPFNYDTDSDGFSDYGELFYYTPKTNPLDTNSFPSVQNFDVSILQVNKKRGNFILNVGSDIKEATIYKVEETNADGTVPYYYDYNSPLWKRFKRFFVHTVAGNGIETRYFRASAWKEITVDGKFNTKLRVTKYSNVIPVVLDYTFSQLDFELKQEDFAERQGSVKLVANPIQPSDPILLDKLMKEVIEYGFWQRTSSEGGWWDVSEKNYQEVDFANMTPKNYELFAVTNGRNTIFSELVGINTELWPVKKITVNPPTNMPFSPRFPLAANEVSIINGGAIVLPECGGESSGPYEVELPNDVELVLPLYVPISSPPYEIQKIPGAPSGYQRYRYIKPYHEQYRLFTLSFLTKLSNVSREMKLSCDSSWQHYQTLKLNIKELPKVQLPKRLITSIAHMNFGEFGQSSEEYLKIYKNLGFNTVPGWGLHWADPRYDNKNFFTPEQRTAEQWKDLKYGVEHSTFHETFFDVKDLAQYMNYTQWTPQQLEKAFFDSLLPEEQSLILAGYDFNGINYILKQNIQKELKYDIIDLLVKRDYLDKFVAPGFNFDRAWLPANYVLDVDKEYEMWAKAIAFFSKTGFVDVSYRGYFFQRHLEALRQQVAKYKPDYLFIDTELPQYPSFELPFEINREMDRSLVRDVHLSSLAQKKYLDNEQRWETNYELARRVDFDYFKQMADAIHQGNSQTKVHIYLTNAEENGQNFVFPYKEVVSELSIILGPEVYIEERYPWIYCNMLKENRRWLDEGRVQGQPKKELIPWLGNGVYGRVKPEVMFNAVAQGFLCGATGITLYNSNMDLDDFEEILKISEAINLIAPYEDMILDGEFADGKITNTQNAIVSVYEYKRAYLLSVTPLSTDKESSFELNVGSGNYNLSDLRNAQYSIVSGPKIYFNKKLDKGTILLISFVQQCGDGICSSGESCSSCSADCGKCPGGGNGGGGGGGGGDKRDGGDGKKACVVEWRCTDWDVCIKGVQRRTCFDANACNITDGKPFEIRECGGWFKNKILNGGEDQITPAIEDFIGMLKEKLSKVFGNDKSKPFAISLIAYAVLILVLAVILVLINRKRKKIERIEVRY